MSVQLGPMNTIYACQQHVYMYCLVKFVFISEKTSILKRLLDEKKRKKCADTLISKSDYYYYSGCKSEKVTQLHTVSCFNEEYKKYRIRYCGGCVSQKCCLPEFSKTVDIKFTCRNGLSFYKQIEKIVDCNCSRECSKKKVLLNYVEFIKHKYKGNINIIT